jgi:hypothetical protein
VLFGTWALVHFAVFSLQRGIFHPYYVTALAPAAAALCGAGVVTLWDWARRSWAGLAALDGALVLCALVALRLLARTPDFAPALRSAIPWCSRSLCSARSACGCRRCSGAAPSPSQPLPARSRCRLGRWRTAPRP